ncbi:UNVERIFIED_CONTAM: LEAF RUST 10 DISEASE-RESISTANCE LOCUS RECEPTOR-LIKE PROTEIN KINASE-like 1.3 [Sesamum radiatum]|uniref:LEAF RUST 10 DISEASE-RESISTANCE LOCUS RECEPTOR-LIKE PROTEIN KINASE-like 1.3 n=1 Tax=Sesamum radiatum TaxID=300843 RepID=A0AAW2V4N6_SESRA
MEWKPKQPLFLFLVATLLPLHFPSFYCQYNQLLPNCSRSFQCGSIGNISYPFSGGDQPEACGYTGFQLFKCEDEFPVLDIPPLAYRVLDLNISTRTLRVARQDLLNDACPGILYSTTLKYEFPDSNDENVTLFFGCVRVRKNGLKTSLPNQFACIDLFTIGNESSGTGPNIKCNDSISVPVNRAAAQALKNSTASSNADVLQEAFAAGFLIQWLTAPVRMCTDRRCNIYPGSQWNTQVTAAPSPVFQEEPRGIVTCNVFIMESDQSV